MTIKVVKGAEGQLNRAAWIREYREKHPNAKASEIATKLAEKLGPTFKAPTANYIHNILGKDKKSKGGKGKVVATGAEAEKLSAQISRKPAEKGDKQPSASSMIKTLLQDVGGDFDNKTIARDVEKQLGKPVSAQLVANIRSNLKKAGGAKPGKPGRKAGTTLPKVPASDVALLTASVEQSVTAAKVFLSGFDSTEEAIHLLRIVAAARS